MSSTPLDGALEDGELRAPWVCFTGITRVEEQAILDYR